MYSMLVYSSSIDLQFWILICQVNHIHFAQFQFPFCAPIFFYVHTAKYWLVVVEEKKTNKTIAFDSEVNSHFIKLWFCLKKIEILVSRFNLNICWSSSPFNVAAVSLLAWFETQRNLWPFFHSFVRDTFVLFGNCDFVFLVKDTHHIHRQIMLHLACYRF